MSRSTKNVRSMAPAAFDLGQVRWEGEHYRYVGPSLLQRILAALAGPFGPVRP